MSHITLSEQLSRIVKSLQEDVTLPSFFELGENPVKKSPVEKKVKTEIGKNLKRGVNDKMLGDFSDEDYVHNKKRDVRVVEFRDERHFDEALSILGRDLDIGVPSYERGIDNKSMVFNVWKADDKMKKRIEDAIDLLMTFGLVQNSAQYPHFRKYT